jgi:hypothetical protein
VGDVGVKGRNIKGADDGSAGNLVFDGFKFPKKVWGVMNIGGNKWNKRLDEVVNEEGYVLGGRAVARDDRSTRIARLMDLWEEIKPSSPAICGREESVGLVRELITLMHVIQCKLNLLRKCVSRIRIKGIIVITVIKVMHSFIDILLPIHNNYC